MAKAKKTNNKPKKTNAKKKALVPDMFEEIQKVKKDYASELEQKRNNKKGYLLNDSGKEPGLDIISTEIVRDKPSFDFNKPIYLQLHKGNIYSIFSSALITPSKYIKNRAFSDTQSLDENHLVFSNSNMSHLDDSQILIEIILRKTEETILTPLNAIAFTQLPIPISRIRKIFASNEAIKREIIQTALSADGGIIPEQLIQSAFPKDLKQIDFEKDVSNTINNYSESLLRFDKILGAFAFLKNFSWLLVNRTNQLNVIPQHLFYMANAVSAFTEFRKVNNDRATLFYKQLFGIQNEIEKPFLKWIFNRLNNEKNFTDNDTKDFGTAFLATLQNKDFLVVAKKLLNDLTDSLKRKKAIQEIWQQQDTDKSFLYLFSFLRTYGNTSTEDKSTSRKDIPEVITTDPFIGEYVFACLGYFYGYKLLRNFEDKIKINDKYIIEVAELSRPLPLKFDLTTLFDYAIIESVYQLVFNSNPNLESVQYIDLPSIKRELIRRPNNLPSEYTYSFDEVLGKYNFTITRKSLVDDVLEHLNKVGEAIPVVSELGVYLLRNGVPKTWINFYDLFLHANKWKYIVSFSREHIVEAIRGGKINTKELIQRINIGLESKEF